MTENKPSFMQEQKKAAGEIFRRNVMMGVYALCSVANAGLALASKYSEYPNSTGPLFYLAFAGLVGIGYNYGKIGEAEQRLRPPQPIIGEPKPSFRPEPKSPMRPQSTERPTPQPKEPDTESRIPEPKPKKPKVYPEPHDTLGKIGGGSHKDMEGHDDKFGG
jgi:hypothetical protein